jgi:hypothetical protein
MKLSKKYKDRLHDIYNRIEKSINFIMEENTSIVRKYGDDSIAINKEIGSELCYLYTAQKQLKQILTEQYQQ